VQGDQNGRVYKWADVNGKWHRTDWCPTAFDHNNPGFRPFDDPGIGQIIGDSFVRNRKLKKFTNGFIFKGDDATDNNYKDDDLLTLTAKRAYRYDNQVLGLTAFPTPIVNPSRAVFGELGSADGNSPSKDINPAYVWAFELDTYFRYGIPVYSLGTASQPLTLRYGV
jgi:hypothetical protein